MLVFLLNPKMIEGWGGGGATPRKMGGREGGPLHKTLTLKLMYEGLWLMMLSIMMKKY